MNEILARLGHGDRVHNASESEIYPDATFDTPLPERGTPPRPPQLGDEIAFIWQSGFHWRGPYVVVKITGETLDVIERQDYDDCIYRAVVMSHGYGDADLQWRYADEVDAKDYGADYWVERAKAEQGMTPDDIELQRLQFLSLTTDVPQTTQSDALTRSAEAA